MNIGLYSIDCSHKCKVLQIHIIKNTIFTPTPLFIVLLSPENHKEKVSTGFAILMEPEVYGDL